MQCKTSTNVLWFSECLCLRQWKHLFSWGRITQAICTPFKNRWKSHFKADVRDIWKVDIGTIRWDFWIVLRSVGKILFGNNYLWSMMKKSSVSRMQRLLYSQIVLCLGKVNQNPTSNTVWEQQLDWCKDSSQCRTSDTVDPEPMEFELNIFTGSTTWQLVQEVQKFMNKMGEPEQFQGRTVFMSMVNDIIWKVEDYDKK